LAVSPTGQIAAAILLGGSDGPKNAWFYNRNGRVAVLKIDGKKVTRIGDVAVGAIPEGAVFSPDGKWLYVGNYGDKNISILRVDGDRVTDTGKTLSLPGSPASMRGRVQ
jgi:DNA-binding beta-propeller fold protein YncE